MREPTATEMATPGCQVDSTGALPVHFFTIVLNGLPFIRYHADVFDALPCRWHWHIIEGVADLKHDTAWSLKNGARITDSLHDQGLSNDGTSRYLDELVASRPDRITVYRPSPRGRFWDGKLEMVNAPLSNIREECLLWQVDADEFWTSGQIAAVRALFLDRPDRHAALFWCNYFVGPELIVSTRHTYGNNSNEWMRVWRFGPGYFWAAHEPPRLAERLPNGQARLVSDRGTFTQEETEDAGLVFQHFAYAVRPQLQFKEMYYGYQGAAEQWERLQAQSRWPVRLSEYFPWVSDSSLVDLAAHHDIVPLVNRAWLHGEPGRGPQGRN